MRCLDHKSQPNNPLLNRSVSLDYLFASWCGRVVAIVGQVSSEDVELAGNHPPRVSHGGLVLWGQEDPELAGGERRRRHRWAFPRPQTTQRAVSNLKETGIQFISYR